MHLDEKICKTMIGCKMLKLNFKFAFRLENLFNLIQNSILSGYKKILQSNKKLRVPINFLSNF